MRVILFVLIWVLAGRAAAAGCPEAPAFNAAAAYNAVSVAGSDWTFTAGREGAPEGPGWAVYAPLTAHTIGTACGPATSAFAAKLAAWQRTHGLKPDGRMDAATAAELTQVWHAARRHSRRVESEACRHAEEGRLVDVSGRDVWGKPEKLLPGAYAAYRQMMAAARREAPAIFKGPIDLRIVSAWRTQERDTETCKTRTCSRVSMARSCSAHWSGAALDLNVGFLPGHGPADMAWSNRLFMVQQPAYRWLIANAGRFGFANYFAEPWHWEWNGD
jgi:hypothetical protein